MKAVDEMVRQHHQLSGHELEQIPGDSEGQENLVCCSLWGHKESDTIQQLINNKAAVVMTADAFRVIQRKQ